MLVDASGKEANITYVYTFNDTAAFVWEMLSAGDTTEEEIAAELSSTYDVSFDTALADVRHLLESWLESGLVSE